MTQTKQIVSLNQASIGTEFTPCHLQKHAGQMVQNGSKQIFLIDSKNIYISALCIMHAPFSLRARYVHSAQRQKGACLVQNPVIYMFLESVRKVWKNEPTISKSDIFVEKIFFHPF